MKNKTPRKRVLETTDEVFSRVKRASTTHSRSRKQITTAIMLIGLDLLDDGRLTLNDPYGATLKPNAKKEAE